MKKLLKINDVAQITGLSVNGIRYYEREGVIKPIYRGKYRYYKLSMVSTLTRTMSFRSLGFSLSDAVRLAHCASVDELQSAFLRQRQTVEEEIVEKQRVLNAIENRVRCLNEIRLQYGRCSLAQGPEYYMEPELILGSDGTDIPKKNPHGQNFFAQCGQVCDPLVAPAILIPLEELRKTKDILTVRTGPGVPGGVLSQENRELLRQDTSVCCFVPQLCIYTVTHIGEGVRLQRSFFSHVFQYAAHRNLEFSGDAYTYRLAALEESPGADANIYIQAWFPVLKK